MARTSKSRGKTPFQMRSGNASPYKFLGKLFGGGGGGSKVGSILGGIAAGPMGAIMGGKLGGGQPQGTMSAEGTPAAQKTIVGGGTVDAPPMVKRGKKKQKKSRGGAKKRLDQAERQSLGKGEKTFDEKVAAGEIKDDVEARKRHYSKLGLYDGAGGSSHKDHNLMSAENEAKLTPQQKANFANIRAKRDAEWKAQDPEKRKGDSLYSGVAEKEEGKWGNTENPYDSGQLTSETPMAKKGYTPYTKPEYSSPMKAADATLVRGAYDAASGKGSAKYAVTAQSRAISEMTQSGAIARLRAEKKKRKATSMRAQKRQAKDVMKFDKWLDKKQDKKRYS